MVPNRINWPPHLIMIAVRLSQAERYVGRRTVPEYGLHGTTKYGKCPRTVRDSIRCFVTGILQNGSSAAVGRLTGNSLFSYPENRSNTPLLRSLPVRYGHSMNAAHFFGQRTLSRFS